MPYATNADLSAAVKKAHPAAHVQTVFRAAFNAAKGTGKYSEQDAFRIAHAAADHAEGKKAVYFRPKADPPAKPKATHTAKRRGGIHIKPENTGKFTAKAKAAGKTVAAYAAEKASAPGKLGQEARFAKAARSWKH